MKFPMFRDSGGVLSISFTMMIIGFIAITLWLVISIASNIAGVPIKEFDATTAMTYFSPLAMLYFGRKWTTASNIGSSMTSTTTTSSSNSSGGKPPVGSTSSSSSETTTTTEENSSPSIPPTQ